MTWDSDLRAHTGFNVWIPGIGPRTFKSHEEYVQWQVQTSKPRSKAAVKAKQQPRKLSRAEKEKQELSGEGAAARLVSNGENNADDDELHDLFMSAPEEISWSTAANEEAAVEETINDQELEDMFLAESEEITWVSDSGEPTPAFLPPSSSFLSARQLSNICP